MGSRRKLLHHGHVQRPAVSRRELVAQTSSKCYHDVGADLDAVDVSTGLVAGFRPFRDSFLVHSLSRLNDLIYKMFPDVDGYIGKTNVVYSTGDLLLIIYILIAYFILFYFIFVYNSFACVCCIV